MDLLVVSIPVLDLQYPPSSPAIIKACAVAAGFDAATADFNLLFRKQFSTTQEFQKAQLNFEIISKSADDSLELFDLFFSKDKEQIKHWVDACIEHIRKVNPVWLGISVFSYKSHKAAIVLCDAVRKWLPNIKIVLGGRGASSWPMGPDHSYFRSQMTKKFGNYKGKVFGEVLLDYNLADNLIQGDGEQAIIDLLSSTKFEKNVRTSVDDVNLETLPYVDFDNYDLDQYEYVNEPTIPITGSKGCVRKCTFCDIPVLWPKFKFRTGEHIAGEMIHLYKKHGVRKFYMSDSLVNGSMKAFKQFIHTLADYNTKNPEAKLKWVGQYITRSMGNELSDEYYDLLKASGGEGLTIGVESGSDAVRAHMKKQFKTIDIDTELEHFDKRQIVCVLLFFSCYPTETYEDFLDTVKMFVRYQKYCASGTVYKLTLGIPYTHHPDTPLWNMQEEIGLTVKKGSDVLWILNNNPTLTVRERIRRRLILHEVATILKLPMSRSTPELNQLIATMELHRDEIDDFFPNEPGIHTYTDKYNLLGTDLLMPHDIQDIVKNQLDQHPEYVEQILSKHTNTIDDIQFDNVAYTHLKNLLL